MEQALADSGLIRFDRRVQAFLGVLLLSLAVGTAFKLHGSSIGMWNQRLSKATPDAGVLFGTPRGIRSDEWLFATPAIVSQARMRPAFPVINSSWGAAQVPLIINLPAWHWSLLARPQLWGFFVLDLERGFAFYWNMKAFLLLTGVFLLLLSLTGNDFGVALLGTGWAFFSGFMQWWYSTPAMLPETVGCVALVVVAAHHLVLSSRRWVIGVAALVFALCLLDAVMSLYPPFLVPLFYLGVAILAGSLGPQLAAGAHKRELAFRSGAAITALSLVAVVLALYYRDIKPAVDLMTGTLYPGSRISLGGEVSVARAFGGFYGFFMSEESYPTLWDNVCEASNFVLLFPVPMVALLWRALRKQRVTALEWSLLLYLVVIFAWMTLHWPHGLAAASALGLSTGVRSLLGLGLANIILCCVFLAERRVDLPAGLVPRLLVAISLLALLLVFALDFGRVTGDFATRGQVALASLVAASACYLLLARQRLAFAVCLLAPSIWSYGLVNPVAVGLGPILETRLFEQLSQIVDREPAARWTVYGGIITPDLVKATGAQVWNGTKVVPQLADLRVLDPSSTAASTYNRFAHIGLIPEKGSEVGFTLLNGSVYTIKIDPISDLWRRLGIRYVALPFAATDREFLAKTALVLELPEFGLWVYRYQWSFLESAARGRLGRIHRGVDQGEDGHVVEPDERDSRAAQRRDQRG